MSSDPHRDPTTDRLIANALRPRETGGAACLDAEALAAWADGAFDAARVSAIEAHLAECARCQSMLAAFAAADPGPAAAAGPAVVLPMRPRPAMRWLVPALATAAAASLIVWTAWPIFRSAAPSAPVPEPASTLAQATPDPRPPQAPPRLAEAAAPAPTPAPPRQTAEAASVKPKAESRREVTATAGTVQGGAATAKAVAEPPVGAAAAPPAPPAVVATPPARAGQLRPDPPTVSVNAASDLVQTLPRADRSTIAGLPLKPGARIEFQAGPPRAGLAVAQDALARRAGGARGGGGGRGGAAAASEVAVRPPSPVRWRIEIDGPLSKSIDGGATWTVVTLTTPAPVTNGVAPSDAVCWLIGRQGLVLRSTDAAKFTRVAFPDASDLAVIAATDAQNARVTTLDGRIFVTADGGLTWTRAGGLQGFPPSPF